MQRRDLTIVYITVAALLMATLGTGAGWFMFNNSSTLKKSPNSEVLSDGTSKQVDESMFANEADAEGFLKQGGTDGEGTHRLERADGDDVYLLSTVMDLDSFVGKKVQIWGNTISSQEAGWLMDVGRVKILK